MLLVAGGQRDPNIGRLLRRLLERQAPFVDLLSGPDSRAVVQLDLSDLSLVIDGTAVTAEAVFLRHDSFWQEEREGRSSQSAALNWYHLVRGWARATGKRMFNTGARTFDTNKIENLVLARRAGLAVPETVVSNDFEASRRQLAIEEITKPVAGGELTQTVERLQQVLTVKDPLTNYPRFVQKRLARPELRVYLIGEFLHAFSIESEDLDYRERHRALIREAEIPPHIAEGLRMLCASLELDFAAADFMLDGDGQHIFLEINAQPMFAAFDVACHGRLTDSIVRTLVPSPN